MGTGVHSPRKALPRHQRPTLPQHPVRFFPSKLLVTSNSNSLVLQMAFIPPRQEVFFSNLREEDSQATTPQPPHRRRQRRVTHSSNSPLPLACPCCTVWEGAEGLPNSSQLLLSRQRPHRRMAPALLLAAASAPSTSHSKILRYFLPTLRTFSSSSNSSSVRWYLSQPTCLAPPRLRVPAVLSLRAARPPHRMMAPRLPNRLRCVPPTAPELLQAAPFQCLCTK